MTRIIGLLRHFHAEAFSRLLCFAVVAGSGLLCSETASAFGNLPIPQAFNVGTVTTNPASVCSSTKVSVPSGGNTPGVTATNVTTTGSVVAKGVTACATLSFPASLTGVFSIGNEPSSGSYPVFTGSYLLGPNYYAQPKFSVVGLFYAPPCSSGKSASSVVYGTADQLKVDNSLTNEYTQSDSVTLTGNVSFVVYYVPVTISTSGSYGWSSSTTTGTDVAVTTSSSENYTVDGCVGVDGVNHNDDIIWIWLNPVLPYYIPPSGSSLQNILVLGIGSDGRDPVTSQTEAPDLVQLSVIQIQNLISVLNANETPTNTNTGIETSTLQELERTWDTTWSTNSGGEPGPGLVAADLQTILSADPFAANPSFNPATSTRYALVSNDSTIPYDATATPTMFSYTGQAIDAVAQTDGTDDQHYVGVEVSVTIGALDAMPVGASAKLDYMGKWLWDTKSQSTTTNTSTQTAMFNIWSPAASYTGPDQLAVYWDTVYQTFTFYAF
jgi:hypothetical protein